MAYKRSWSQEITIAANTSKQQFAFTPPDTNQNITITGIYATDTTARHTYGLVVNGDEKLTVDAPAFAAGNDRVHVDVDFPQGATCFIEAVDRTGVGAANIGVTIFYEVNNP